MIPRVLHFEMLLASCMGGIWSGPPSSAEFRRVPAAKGIGLHNQSLFNCTDVGALILARCVEKAATGGWVGSGSSRGHSHEYDRDCC